MKGLRKMWKPYMAKALCSCLALVLMVGLCILSAKGVETEAEETIAVSVSQGTAEEALQLYAQAAILMDAESGRVLYDKNGGQILANASTTKIMTCILALENGNLEDEVTVSSYAAGMPKVKLFMSVGEHYKLKDLLYSLMLESHNDSAVAIAEHIGGSVDGFAAMMNQKAKEVGCENTCFLTPNGLDAVNSETGAFHSTTAVDLARIMAYCINESEKKEEFLQITRTQDYSFTNAEGRSFSCHNHNALLSLMEGAVSGKTGFTNKAGYCYVGAVQKDDRLFTIALLACGWPNNKTYKWKDCQTLFGYGFDTYQYEEVYEEQRFKPILVEGGIAEENDPFHQAYVDVEVKAEVQEESLRLLLKESDLVEVNSLLKEKLEAPIEKGEEVGSVVYTLNGQVVKTYPIVTTGDVERQSGEWLITYIVQRFLL